MNILRLEEDSQEKGEGRGYAEDELVKSQTSPGQFNPAHPALADDVF